MRSVMHHSFSKAPQAKIPRSSFDRSHGHKTTFDAGLLVPFFVDEALPGDTFNARLTAFARMATPLFPLMDNLRMSFFFFSVPNRLVWDNWEKFCGAQDDPGDSIDFTIPTINVVAAPGALSIADYMGIPLVDNAYQNSSALPFRAYNLIWNEWFRDQNLQDSLVVSTADGPDTTTGRVIQRRGKRHDYFTSCLPWAQKGTSVALPLGTSARVATDANDNDFISVWSTTSGAGAYESMDTGGGAGDQVRLDHTGTGAVGRSLYADLSNATAATINQLRQSFQIQKLLERDARGGTRYREVIKAHFGVESADQRLQRPEYLGGGSIPVNINAVPQTSATGLTGGTTDQGSLTAYGTAGGQVGFTKSFTEHCILIGLVCVDADLTYQQGLERMWSRSTRYDFYWPALAHIGEQSVLNKEIYLDTTASGTNDNVFGYQERYAEYRYKPSRLSGQFRSAHGTSLDAWHLSEDFASLPVLNDSFITSEPPVDRVIATPAEPHFIFDSYMQLRCARPMPMFGVPGMIDHF